jgi:hypothetical protein
MAVESDVDELQRTLADVGERIARYRGSRIGEQNTKVALVTPVLRALGWDVEDLEEVQLEYRRKSGDRPVDYALLLQREPILFIEAKALDENLDDRKWASQIISYAAVAGVEWVVLTNGDEYRIYNAHAPVPVEDKLFRGLHISANSAETVEALRLLTKAELRKKSLATLWRAQTIDNRVRQAVKALFEPEPSPWLVGRLTRALDGLTQGDVKAALSRARITLDFPPAEPGGIPVTGQRVRNEGRAGAEMPASYDVTVKDLLDGGFIRPGAELRKRYLGHDVTATVEPDGRVRFGDEVYNSLSIAAGAARVAVKGSPPDGRRYYQTNGWTFWECEAGAGEWHPIDDLRQRYIEHRISEE